MRTGVIILMLIFAAVCVHFHTLLPAPNSCLISHTQINLDLTYTNDLLYYHSRPNLGPFLTSSSKRTVEITKAINIKADKASDRVNNSNVSKNVQITFAKRANVSLMHAIVPVL